MIFWQLMLALAGLGLIGVISSTLAGANPWLWIVGTAFAMALLYGAPGP